MALLTYRPVRDAWGFSRESVIAITTNIKNQEIRRREAAEKGIEHPRASSTDDVECLFSILNEKFGNNFTMKNVQSFWKNLCREFSKKLNNELPYYYHTSDKNRYRLTDLPAFFVFLSPP